VIAAQKTFNELAKAARIRRGVTLRQCAADLGLDPSNLSKVERGVNPAPRDVEILRQWSEYLQLDADQRAEFLDAAALSRREIPSDIADDKKLMATLPAFFRSLREADMSDQKLGELLEDLRKAHTTDPKS
jgi:transcriptional regulator with XRE-family HTH domain